MTFWCGSTSVPLTNGSGSGRPKNMRLWIRIPNTVMALKIWSDIHLLTPLNVCVSFFSLERYRQKNNVRSWYCSLPSFGRWCGKSYYNYLKISNSHNLIHNSCRYGGSVDPYLRPRDPDPIPNNVMVLKIKSAIYHLTVCQSFFPWKDIVRKKVS